jgi:hypothetical protein
VVTDMLMVRSRLVGAWVGATRWGRAGLRRAGIMSESLRVNSMDVLVSFFYSLISEIGTHYRMLKLSKELIDPQF